MKPRCRSRGAERETTFMRAALRLAAKGKGFTSPNPAVGALIVKNGRVIGRGWHHRSGEAHAEVRALEQAGSIARGATMYVTLEPCCTYGRTPPCTGAVVRAGIRRVVVAALDPNPRHNGRGINLLRRKGIRVSVGLLGERAAALNEDFAKHVRTGIPFTTVKVAMSMDGKIATSSGDSRWISGAAARQCVHRLRLRIDAVLIGRKTAELDDPLLTARPHGRAKKTPWRIILDSSARLPLTLKVLKPPGASKTMVAVTAAAPRARVARIEALGARVIRLPSREGRVPIRALWRRLGRMGIMSVLVEGGGETIASALSAGVVDNVMVFISPKIIGGRLAPTAVGGTGVRRIADAVRLRSMSVRRMGEDLLLQGSICDGTHGASSRQ
jgi:diaminohydroxyphosphoribosylaminopyrimidine deaminase/5-amino-6-(5-phosphoribosylamino)uracil reductase